GESTGPSDTPERASDPQPTAASADSGKPGTAPTALQAGPLLKPGARPPEPGSSSRREIEQLVKIRALLASDPAAAYRLAKRSEQEFPRGLLSEERQALAIVALARSGDLTEAKRKEREFGARFPQSSLRQLIDAALQR
ncbi:MAG: hypothetical protein ABW321_03635, partial [Polyangiales bacterium]